MIKNASQILAEIGDEEESLNPPGRPRKPVDVEDFDCDRSPTCNGPARPGRLCKRCISIRMRRRKGIKPPIPAAPTLLRIKVRNLCLEMHESGVRCEKQRHKTVYIYSGRGYVNRNRENPHRAGDFTWL